MKMRIGYYDMARGLGIIFVVIGHIDSFYAPVRSVVITFHMALFLMISGMLILETGEEMRSFTESFKKKFRRIMVPYILFSFLSLGIELVRLTLQNVFYWPHYKALLISVFSFSGNSVMWFLPALFISEMMFLGIRRCRNDLVTAAAVLATTIFAVWVNTWKIGGDEFGGSLIFALNRGVFCTVFIAIGYFVRKYIMILQISRYVYGGLSITLLMVCVWINTINIKVDLRAMDWGKLQFYIPSMTLLLIYRVILYLIEAACGALGIIFGCRVFEPEKGNVISKMIIFLGNHSLVIMATHLDFHVLHYSMDLAAWINGLFGSSLIYHTLLLLFVFAAEAVLIKIIDKYAPVLSGKIRK